MSGHVDGPLDPQKKMQDALRFYADERNWLNDREVRWFPGFHGRLIAANALAALEKSVVVTVRCVGCKATREVGPGGVPSDDVPMCASCCLPMIAESALSSVETRSRHER